VRLDDRNFGIPCRATTSRPVPKRIYKPRQGLNDFSVLSKSRYGRSFRCDKAGHLANVGLNDALTVASARQPLFSTRRRTKMPMRSNWRSITAATVFILASAYGPICRAACIPQGLATPAPRDPVALVLAAQDSCPKDAMEFVDILKRSGARLEPTMVNFEGFHNPDSGGFFIFEIVSSDGAPSATFTIERGDMLFGHFTTATDDGQLVSNRSNLVIELIAWDPDKQFYNFYELVDGNWFYRGDSKDILDVVQLLHRQRTASQHPFGKGLRCAGCHVNGGLLQKELAPPHNDWFVQDRQLPLGALQPDSFVKGRLADLVDAGELSNLVAASARRLADSPGYRKVIAARSMQEQLRPLFCPMELNIESDSQPFDDRKAVLRIPSAFFVDPRLASADITIQRQDYDAALRKLGSELPETTPGRADADHGWLMPVKAQSDIVAIDALVDQGVVDKGFVADVLSVDLTNPIFSRSRCGLLKLVPDKGGSDFVARFQNALRGSSLPGAAELLGKLSDPTQNADFAKKQADAFLTTCQQRAADPSAVLDWARLLAQRRVEVSASEISQDPRGHILEDPGRVVFPSTEPKAVAGHLALTPACQVQ